MRLTMADINPVSRVEVDQQGVYQGKMKTLKHRARILEPFWQNIM